MAKKPVKKTPPKSKAREDESKGKVPGDFELNPEFYDQRESFEVYATEKKLTKIFGVRSKSAEDSEPYLKARTRSKRPIGWRFSYGVDLHSSSHVARFIQGLTKLAQKLGWRLQVSDDLETLKGQLRDSEETILRLEKTNTGLREKHEELMSEFRARQEQILKSRVEEFASDVEALEKLLVEAQAGKVDEQTLQEFLYAHPWLFGTEYVNAEPQKLRGAHSRFDFYLERFNKTNDIVEIKLASDVLINKDGSLAAKVGQSVDQLIDYMESSQAAAHSTVISEEEGIRELRPRGILIIGNDISSEARRKLHKWNYQFAHITILTYSDVLERAKGVVKHLQSAKEK